MLKQTKEDGFGYEYMSNYIPLGFRRHQMSGYGIDFPEAIIFQFNFDINHIGPNIRVSVCNENFQWEGGPRNIFEAWKVAEKHFKALPWYKWVTLGPHLMENR